MSDESEATVNPLEEETTALRVGNAALTGRIEQLGMDLDVSTPRIEHLMQSLVDIGVITELQMWEMQRNWERHLRGELVRIHDKIVEKMRSQVAATRLGVDPQQPKLIVPESTRRDS
jgi:hypothetical protein